MKNPKPGERVAVYWGNLRQTGIIVPSHLCDKDYGCLTVKRDDNGDFVYPHPKQCRRLKPKAQRRVWIKTDDIPKGANGSRIFVSAGEMVGPHRTQFIERKPKGGAE